MTNARINGLRSIELGVHDLQKSAEFYRKVWALEDCRGRGRHHSPARHRPRAPRADVARAPAGGAARGAFLGAGPSHGRCVACQGQGDGRQGRRAPGALEKSAGGGYGFRVSTPEGHPILISSDVAHHEQAIDDRSRPTKLTHVVLNSAEVEKQTAFFLDVLGFKWSDSTFMMDFVRCCSDHHSVAFARGNGPTLNHMAYEMPNIDGLMRGAGRVRKSGYEIMWGVGRHGPGSNVFSYFVEPNGFVTEYTTEVEQVGDNYVGHDCRLVEGAERVPVPLEHGGRAVASSPARRCRAAVRGREPALRSR